MFDELFEFTQNNDADELNILSVSDLTKCIRIALEADDIFADIWVKGEVSNLTRHSNGHIYFSLKDDSALIRCVIWSGAARNIKQKIADGANLIVHGRLSIYDKQGQYQLTIDQVMEKGIGGLYEAYEKLKSQLREEGLFNEEHKIPIPSFPSKIAMITSPTGSVIRDMVSIARRRFPSVDLVIIPTIVQGDAAPGSIVKSIEFADKHSNADVIILGRGGGSFEDLMCFSDESVVRAIHSCKTPIISAVGHETDTTLADLAADLRAPTPSAAMEIALPDKEELLSHINKMAADISSSMQQIIDRKSSKLDTVMSAASFKYPDRMINEKWQTLDIAKERMYYTFAKIVADADSRLGELSAQLNSLSPLNVIARGYSVIRRDDGTLIRSVKDTFKGEITDTLITDGVIVSKIIDLKEGWSK